MIGGPLWWIPGYPPEIGGVETFASVVAPALAERGVAPTLLVTHGGPSDTEVDGLQLLRRPLLARLDEGSPTDVIRARRDVAELKAARTPSAYHLHLTDATPVLHLTTLAVAPAPTILTLHNEPNGVFGANPPPETIMRRLMEEASIVTAVSPTVGRIFATADPRLAAKLVTIPNGLAVPDPPGPPPTEPRLLAVGRLTEQKGFDRLLAALPEIARAVPGVTLEIVGAGPLDAALRTQAAELGVDDIVDFVGARSRTEVAEAMERARLVVAPSRFEGLCLVAAEAGLAGRPVVATSVAGLDLVVDDGRTGLLVDNAVCEDDPSVLVEPIVRLLGDDALAATMGATGRRHIENDYGLDACVDAYEAVYASLESPPVDVVVVIPVHDGERHVADAVRSVLADLDATPDLTGRVQVVDDGSTDRTAEVLAAIDDPRVVVFRQPNLGGSSARNAGLALSSGTYVAHLDHDDLWEPGRLARQVAALEADESLDAVFGQVVEFADDAPDHALIRSEPRPARMCGTGLFRRRVHDTIGGFDPTRSHDQFDWVVRAIDGGLRYVEDDGLAQRRRIHRTNLSWSERPSADDRLLSLRRRLAAQRNADAET